MVSIIGVIIVTMIIVVIGGGIGYLVYVKTRPKKIFWNAKVYQKGQGVRPFTKNKKGEIVSRLSLSDLIPYTKDIIEKVDKAPGITLHRLVTLQKVCPEITSDAVEVWGEKEKVVHVLMDGENVTILKKGYDNEAGIIFQPMPHDRIQMISGNIILRKDRIRQEKDMLAAMVPFIVIGLSLASLVGLGFIFVDGQIQMNQESAAATKYAADRTLDAAKINALASGKDVSDFMEFLAEPAPEIPA